MRLPKLERDRATSTARGRRVLVVSVLAALAVANLQPSPALAGEAIRPVQNAPGSRIATTPATTRAEFGRERPAADVRAVADWVAGTGDHRGVPFMIVDKRNARLLVFDGRARLVAASAILLGAARGDDSVPGIGERPIADIKPHERTTPAGRFVAESGRNLQGEDIVWIDYDAAVSMHRLRANDRRERRRERLATATAADNRISYGCINVPAAFFDAYVKPAFGRGTRAIVYVLPETRPLQDVLPIDRVSSRSAAESRGARTSRSDEG